MRKGMKVRNGMECIREWSWECWWIKCGFVGYGIGEVGRYYVSLYYGVGFFRL